MTAFDIVKAVTAAALVWSTGVVAVLIARRGGRPAVLYAEALFSLLAVVAAVSLGSVIDAGHNWVELIVAGLTAFDLRDLTAAGLGVCLGLAPAIRSWILWSGDRRPSPRERLSGLAVTAAFLGSLVMMSLFAAEPQVAKLIGAVSRPAEAVERSELFVVPGFEVELYHQFYSQQPVQIAVSPRGGVYVCYREESGGVAQVVENPLNGQRQMRIVATDLNLVNGLAFDGDDLYVSRSSLHTVAENGRLEYQPTGAVTLLRDLDSDGVADYYHDVIPNLPGSQAPDPLHQNNGLVISPDRRLFVAIGAHFNQGPNLGEFDGTIATAALDGSGLRVFARGMRNPFDCAFGPGAQLFCTDNDISYGHLDELNHVRDGEHYGHPYMNDGKPPAGSIEPIWISTASSIQGITWADSAALPDAYRDRLYVAAYGSGEIFKVDLTPDGETFQAQTSVFARIPHALDVAAAPNGDFFVSCHFTKRIYRIRMKP